MSSTVVLLLRLARRSRAIACAAGVLLAIGSLIGCAPQGAERVVARHIENGESPRLLLGKLLRAETISETRFESAEDRAHFEVRDGAELRPIEGGALLVAKGRATLHHRVDLDATQVHGIEIEVGGLEGGPLRVAWRGPEARGAVLLRQPVRTEGDREIFRADLRSNAGWKGLVRTLRLTATGPAERSERFYSVRAVRLAVDEKTLSESLDRPWKIELGRESRSAVLAPAGHTIEWSVELPRSSSLRVGYGQPEPLRSPVEYRIHDATQPGSAPLFRARLDGDAAGRWHEAIVDLGPRTGATSLQFETEMLAGGTEVAVPMWAHPEVLAPDSQPARPNVVWVSIDTLRADRLSLYGHDRTTSPHLDEWARRRAVVFENAFSTAPWTLPSHVSMFTGMGAVHHGVNELSPAPNDLEFLAERLREEGYKTFGTTGGGFMHPHYGLDQGFDVFAFEPGPNRGVKELDAGLERAEGWLEALAEQEAPFFLLLHTYSVHAPYKPEREWLEAMGGVPPGWESARVRPAFAQLLPDGTGFELRPAVARAEPGDKRRTRLLDEEHYGVLETFYDAGVAETDDRLSRLWAALESLDLYESTLVVVTSDHGEALGDKGLAGHSFVWDFNLHVPLIVALPGGHHAGGRVGPQVSLVDLVPTVLDLLDLPTSASVDGESLLPLLRGDSPEEERRAWAYAPHFNEGLALRVDNELKYILNDAAWVPASKENERIFELEHDSIESINVIEGHPRRDALRREAERHLQLRGSAVVIEIRNETEEPFSSRLRGRDVDLRRLKELGESCHCAGLEAAGSARLTVPVAGVLRLVIDGPHSGPLSLQADGEPGEVLVSVAQRSAHAWTKASGWHQPSGRLSDRPSDREAAVHVQTFTLGEPPGIVGDPSALPAALREQMRALGYLDN